MQKPLIKAIPSKTVKIAGRDYHVYGMTSIPYPLLQDFKEINTVIKVATNGKSHTLHIYWPLKRNPNVSFQELFEQKIEELNRFVENEYLGDQLKHQKTTETFFIEHRTEGKFASTRIRFRAIDPETGKLKHHNIQMGKTSDVTDEDIKKGMALAKKLRLECVTSYNNWLDEKRKAFRQLVEQQLRERDGPC